jgi:hypothetical protein
MRKLAIILATSVVFAISACGTMKEDTMASGGGASADVEQLIKDAEGSIEKAASVGGEWRDSQKKYLKKAKAALSKGDIETAKKLAKHAKFEGEMGYQQAQAQKDAGPWLF